MADLDLAQGVTVLERRSRVSGYAIWAVMITSSLSVIGQYLEWNGSADFDALVMTPATAFAAIAYLLFLPAYLVSIVLVGMWIHRAHANLVAAGLEGLTYTPGWSVGWFFVPFANLFKPFQAMRELWNASHGARHDYDGPAPGLLSAWWAAWIIGNIVDNVSWRLALSAEFETYQASLVLGAIGSALTVVSAWFLLDIMRQVTAAQAEPFGSGA